MDGQLGESAGADRVAGGKHVDQVTIQLGQRLGADPVFLALVVLTYLHLDHVLPLIMQKSKKII